VSEDSGEIAIPTQRGVVTFASNQEWQDMRRGWRINICTAIADLANTEMHRRIWLRPKKPWDHWSDIYEQFLTLLLVEPQDGLLHFQELGYLTAAEASVISDLADVMSSYAPPENWTDEIILADPAWKNVCEIAAQTAERLHPLITEEDETRALTEGDPEWRRNDDED
jgi:hypothetical protein